jgi:signal transduction histidine kinase
VITHAGVWHASGATPARLIAAIDSPVEALATSDSGIYIATFTGRVVRVDPQRSRDLVSFPNRAISLALRNGALWIAYDHHLTVLEPGRDPESLGARDLLPGGGPLLIDHEGSLWMGTGGGLVHFPEPDTRIWDERHGLPSRHTRYLGRTHDTIWVNTWRGSAAIAQASGRWQSWTLNSRASVSRTVMGRQGEYWLSTTKPRPAIVEVKHGRMELRYPAAPSLFGGWIEPDGRVWLATSGGLLVSTDLDRRLVRHRGLPFESDSAPVHALLVDRQGQGWVASESRVCRTADFGRRSFVPALDWTCENIPSGHHLTALRELPGGGIWATLARGGVWRHGAEGWEQIPGSLELPALDMHGLMPARDSGFWLLGTGTVARVIEDRTTPEGWRIIERIGAWHGLHNDGTGDLLEEEDGTVWLTTSAGVVRVPAAARARQPSAPRVVLGQALVDGEPIPLQQPLRLPHQRNRLELRFAAVSYRDPSLLRYEVRIAPDRPWEPVEGEPAFRWVDLPSGRYQAEVRASLDGKTWSHQPARFTFTVPGPWYLRPWVLALLGVVGLAILTVLYRTRVAFLLELERQRTRIAMDLHDEMGSGLGSIGILSSMLSSTRLQPDQRSRLAGEIARTASELGAALSGIVWSLTPRAGTIEEMAGRLAEQGRRLFAAGPAEFVTVFPDPWPDGRLHPSVRRNVLLIVMEALHNAARHASATRVVLQIGYTDPSWIISVEDNGIGLPAASLSGAGVGLDSMRRRAAEIGASVRFDPRAQRGTIVTVQFSTRPRRAQWKRWPIGNVDR